jgi:hypothetical protein
MNPDYGLSQLDEHRENKRNKFKNIISKLLKIINNEENIKTYLFSNEAIFRKYENECFIEMVIHFEDIDKVELGIDGFCIVDINGQRQKIN